MGTPGTLGGAVTKAARVNLRLGTGDTKIGRVFPEIGGKEKIKKKTREFNLSTIYKLILYR